MISNLKQPFNDWFISNYLYKLGQRYNSLALSCNLILDRTLFNIIETGTSRLINNEPGDGCATLLFSEVASLIGGRVWTCDILEENIDICRYITAKNVDHIEYVIDDSVEFLNRFPHVIDFLYLDSMDFIIGGDPNPSQNHVVNEYQAAKGKLSKDSLILIDDCALPNGGKGGKLCPILESDGWKCVFNGYQKLYSK
mgnify:CR=1 FL=1